MNILITENQLKFLAKKANKIDGFLNENKVSDKVFLGYHSTHNELEDGYYRGSSLYGADPEIIREIYMYLISDYDKNIRNDDIEAMVRKLSRAKYYFTFISREPIKGYYSTPKYKYGDYLYKVYGDRSEHLFDDYNEIYAEIVATKKPLYLEMVTEDDELDA